MHQLATTVGLINEAAQVKIQLRPFLKKIKFLGLHAVVLVGRGWVKFNNSFIHKIKFVIEGVS